MEKNEMDWWVSMPKVELHAHLNGSVSDSTLLELARELGQKNFIVFSDVEHVILQSDRSLTEVFKLFDLIHILTTDHDTVTRITKEVVEDFAAENVVYLELRTTPKRNDKKGMTKRSYMEAVIEGLRRVGSVDIDFASSDVGVGRMANSCHMNNTSSGIQQQPPSMMGAQSNSEEVEIYTTLPLSAGQNTCNGKCRKKIYVRLLLSIDRRETLEASMETVKLALEMRDLGVVGIDLSGNPKVGEWKTFLPALRFAREQGLHVTLHCGEVPNQEEIHAMLDFLPERVGHACCLDEDAWGKLKMSKIPVEICLTSNIRTNTISSINVHHFADLYNAKHPLTLCTDDSGVFSTTLSKEYVIATTAFGLEKKEMFQLARNAIEFSFAEDHVVRELRQFFDMAEESLAFD